MPLKTAVAYQSNTLAMGRTAPPALSWDNVPAGTQFIALIVDDPDAPGRTWVHTSNHRPMV
ncbi:MAG: hypothetical protein K8R34_13110 [Methanosarcinales archaeon]|nr:hypothetical protein [Methanosarcinales archaeon]